MHCCQQSNSIIANGQYAAGARVFANARGAPLGCQLDWQPTVGGCECGQASLANCFEFSEGKSFNDNADNNKCAGDIYSQPKRYRFVGGELKLNNKNNDEQKHTNENNKCELNWRLNDKSSESKLRSVANCLAYLVQEPSPACCPASAGDYQVARTSREYERHQLSLIEQRNSFLSDQAKLKRIMDIYARLVLVLPIEAQVNESHWIRGLMLDRCKSVGGARQQVLRMIENLKGYCDSIDLLRCLLRASHLVQVLEAFDEIIQRAGVHLSASMAPTSSLLNADAPKNSDKDDFGDQDEEDEDGESAERVEFRIVREWSV